MTTVNNNTPPRPAFTWLFLATPTGHPNVTPIVVRTEANTEDEARKRFIGWSLVFAAQIRTGTPYQVGWYDPITGMSWHVHGSSVVEDVTGVLHA
ncbi:host cell division inhibitor Icd-like protein [Hafnia paralvei]|uniref:host cell division inhibitor Icd-like protein n=1 Tax=Hafnia paralvei TaxID=546367 RepID=UPI003C5F4261